MPWSKSQISRLGVEKTILEKFFKDQLEWFDPSGNTKIELKLRSNSDTEYKLRVYLPTDFPSSCPNMVVVFPKQLTTKNGQPLPLLDEHFHTLGTVDDFTKLCHYSPELWTDDNTLYQVFMKGRLWIEAYEGHLATGNTMDHYLKHMNQSTQVGNSSNSSEATSNAGTQNTVPPNEATRWQCKIS